MRFDSEIESGVSLSAFEKRDTGIADTRRYYMKGGKRYGERSISYASRDSCLGEACGTGAVGGSEDT